MRNNYAEIFKQLEQDTINEQRRMPINSCLKIFYGITSEKKYRISFISSVNPPEMESTKELTITQGKESENVYWTCFDLNDEEAKEVFFIFCDSLLETIEGKTDESDAILAIKNRYYSWRVLLKNKGKMAYERYQGLFGELYFLSEILMKKSTIEESITAWVGPDGYSKDFSISDTWYEIKTIGANSLYIKINSLTQLESNIDGHLVAVVVEKMSDQYNNGMCSVPILYHSILDKIGSHQLKEIFVNKVLKYGFLDDDSTINNYKFEVKKINSYKVNNKFPKLTKEQIKKNEIANVTYDLHISSLNKYLEDLQ